MGADAELQKFAADLGRLAAGAAADVEPVMKRGAQNIKDDLVSGVRGSQFRGLAGSISYEETSYLSYEIGPDKSRRGGALGNIYYFGGSRGGGHGDLEGPLMREAPNLERELGKVVDGWANQL